MNVQQQTIEDADGAAGKPSRRAAESDQALDSLALPHRAAREQKYVAAGLNVMGQKDELVPLKHSTQPPNEIREPVTGPSAGERLASLRIISGRTQGELARLAGVTRGTVAKYEGGKLEELTCEALLGTNRLITQITKHLKGMLAACSFKGGVSDFMWGMSSKELLGHWQLESVGGRARMLRRLEGMTTAELADKAGVARGVIVRLEAGAMDALGKEDFCREYTQVVKMMLAAGKILRELGFKGDTAELIFGCPAEEVPDMWGVTHQGLRLRIVRRLQGASIKDLRAIGISNTDLGAMEHSPEIVGHAVGRTHNFDFLKVRTVSTILGAIWLPDRLTKVLWGLEFDQAVQRFAATPSTRLRLERTLRGLAPAQVASDQVSVETVRLYEEGYLDTLQPEVLADGTSNAVLVISNLGRILSRIGCKESPCLFLFKAEPQEVVMKWRHLSPAAKLRCLRVLNGVRMAELCEGIGVGITGLQTWETSLPAVTPARFCSPGRNEYKPETTMKLAVVLAALGWQGGLSRFLWAQDAREVMMSAKLDLEQRLRFVLLLAGQQPSKYLPFFRHLRRHEAGQPEEIAPVMIKHLRRAVQAGVAARVIHDAGDLFPGRAHHEIEAVMRDKEATHRKSR